MGIVLNILMLLSLAVGLFFNTMGVLGILRFPDVYTRLHADTKATTFGTIFTSLTVILWAVKAWLYGGHDGQFINLAVHTVLAVVVLAITNATGAHAIARAIYRSGHTPSNAVVDRLADALKQQDDAAAAAPAAVTEEAAPTTPEEVV